MSASDLAAGPTGRTPIIFLAGAVINRMMWKPVIEHLSGDFRCVAVDLPGQGSRHREDFTVDRSIEVVRQAIADHGDGRAVLCGLSLGGYVAQATAAAAPREVAGLVLSGATIRYTGWDGLSTRLYGFGFPVLAPLAMRAFPKELAKSVGAEIADEIVAAGLSARGGGQALRRLPGTDFAARLKGFTGPVAIINGERDKPNIAGVEKFREHVPSAEEIIIEDAGHAVALQQPEHFAAALRESAVGRSLLA